LKENRSKHHANHVERILGLSEGQHSSQKTMDIFMLPMAEEGREAKDAMFLSA
jgi:hypothetical protein